MKNEQITFLFENTQLQLDYVMTDEELEKELDKELDEMIKLFEIMYISYPGKLKLTRS